MQLYLGKGRLGNRPFFKFTGCGLSSLLLILFLSGCIMPLAAQQKMLRLYEDNDLFHIGGKATDKAYSNGTRIDYYYRLPAAPRSAVYGLMLQAGDSSDAVLGISLMQIMITPTDISRTVPLQGDHHYSGALLFVHSLQSASARRRLLVHTEWIAGIMGPAALARQTQTFIHRLTGSPRPRGWAYQLPTDLLLNYNLSVEKALIGNGRTVEAIGGAQAFAGTMLSGAALSATLRLGQLAPYFASYIPPYPSGQKLRWYVLLRQGVDLTLYNALLEGGYFNDNGPKAPAGEKAANLNVRRVVGRTDFGMGVVIKQLSLSFTQKTMSAMIRGLPTHTVGNLSIAYAW